MSLFSTAFPLVTKHGTYHSLAIRTSTSFTIRKAGKYLVTAIGGGGSGAAAPGSPSTYGPGGGAGGLAQSIVLLQAGTVLSIAVGAGGSSGGNGGNTNVTINGTTLIGYGGSSSGAGGSASGGNIMNVTGGNGTAYFMGDLLSTPGGAVGVLGFTPATPVPTRPIWFNTTAYNMGRGANVYDGKDTATTGSLLNHLTEVGRPFTRDRILCPRGHEIGDPGNGGYVGQATHTPIPAGVFGGGGGGIPTGGYGSVGPSGNGNFGGGGGGGFYWNYQSSNVYCNAGRGGDGGLILEWFE